MCSISIIVRVSIDLSSYAGIKNIFLSRYLAVLYKSKVNEILK